MKKVILTVDDEEHILELISYNLERNGYEVLKALTGEEALAYVRLRLEGDDPARSRGYELLMQMLYEGVNSGDLGSMLGLGTKLLGALDTNLNAMTAVTLASAVKGGDDRSELALPTQAQQTSEEPLRADTAAMQQTVKEALYEE